VATIFAWSGALRKRGELDGINDLVSFADKLESAVKQTIEEGTMTGDLAALSVLPEKKVVNTLDFIKAIRRRLEAKMQ
jgi:isocitrate dehydrogenase